jgi:chemotaxis protein CheZ
MHDRLDPRAASARAPHVFPSLAGPPAADLAGRLETIRARYAASDPAMVADVVRAVLSTMAGDLTATETGLLAEVEMLGQTIAAAKAEIAALRIDDINADHIPSATDELDAIVAHTAAATDSILEVCETLDRVASELEAASDIPANAAAARQLQDATTRIYEACSFQDITGQRITKVVATLQTIETKVAHILAGFGDRRRGDPPPPRAAPDAAMLLNGPQVPAAAMDQTDIDKLLASFD